MKKTLLTVGLLVMAMGTAQAQKLTAAGATFPYPIYSKWFSEYSSAHPGVEVNYASIGSGGGIAQVTKGLVDFGASDMPMTDEMLSASPVKLIHIPTVLGAVVPVYNVPGANELRFSSDVLADIYLGKISNWNDARIAKDNPDAKLPDQKIIVVHRSDGSGTSFIWTDFLSKVSKDWAGGPGQRILASVAGGRRWQGQRRRSWTGSPAARRDRIRRADLRAAEQDCIWLGEECGWELCQSLDRGRYRGCREH